MAASFKAEPKRVVRTYELKDAPTGEGTVYVDEHGQHWKTTFYPQYNTTGVRTAKSYNGLIFEDE